MALTRKGLLFIACFAAALTLSAVAFVGTTHAARTTPATPAIVPAVLMGTTHAATPVIDPPAAAKTSLAASGDQIATTIGPARVSVDTSGCVIPAKGQFELVATVTSDSATEYLQARMRVFGDKGRLLYQKTFVSADGAPANFEYANTGAALRLHPGTYPAELLVMLSASDKTYQDTIPFSLIVYDPEKEPVPLTIVARISAQPLSGPDGDFISDPAQFTRAREDTLRIAEYVLADPKARIALSLSPAMLDEWSRISKGYSFIGAEGEVLSAAEEPVPRAYDTALKTLRRAAATGRLEILSAGYSDPDLVGVAATGLTDDIHTQYAWGRKMLADALETSVSAGAAPPSGRLSQNALPQLGKTDIGYVFADAAHVVSGEKEPVSPGAYRSSAGSMTVIAVDSELAGSLTSSPTVELREAVFTGFAAEKQPLGTDAAAITVDVGPNAAEAKAVVSAAQMLYRQPWIEPVLPARLASSATGTATAEATGTVAIQLPKEEAGTPVSYWSTVAAARSAANALVSALGEEHPSAQAAVRNSLIAEGSSWAGHDKKWVSAGKGLDFATSAIQTAESLFSQVSLGAKPITLADDAGRVPITIVNSTGGPLYLMLTIEEGSSMRIGVPADQMITLKPGENYIEIPVRLINVVNSTLRIRLSAADTEITDTTVALSASYLDKIVTVTSVAFALLGILVFIIRRIRTADKLDRDSVAETNQGEA
ncbi:MAG: hypothetical protein FWE94_01370 [Coriobacteriia bacterium]|nr:hypothetical protein [Coriobacteriia bacterium]